MADQIAERTPPAVRLLREARPGVPIVLLGHIPYAARHFSEPARRRYETSNAANEEAFKKLVAEGVGNLHYIPGDDFYGSDGEATVDGGHATDLGFLRMAEVLEPKLREILK